MGPYPDVTDNEDGNSNDPVGLAERWRFRFRLFPLCFFLFLLPRFFFLLRIVFSAVRPPPDVAVLVVRVVRVVHVVVVILFERWIETLLKLKLNS